MHRSGRRWALAALAIAGAAIASVLVGSRLLSPAETLSALLGHDAELEGIVWGVRMPRTAVALAAGAALGLAGSAMRSLTRNPIADPGILGVSGGAALGVALTALWPDATPGVAVTAAVLGAAAVTALLATLSSRGIGSDPVRVTLLGFCLAVAATAIVNALSLVDPLGMASLQAWRSGSLQLVDLDVARWAAIPAVAGAVVLLAGSRSVEMIELGDDLAVGLGAVPRRIRTLLLLSVCGLAGAAVAVAGPITFVGLVAVSLSSRTGRALPRLATAAVAGATLLTGADIVGRVIPGTGEVPAGVMLAFVGGAALVAVLIRARRRASASALVLAGTER